MLQEIKTRFPDLSQAAAQVQIKKAFGSDEAVKFVLQMSQGMESLEGNIASVAQAMKGGTAVTEEMARAIDVYLDQLAADDAADRRNGYYRRHLLTELGDIELNVPRTRRYSPVAVVRAYARRTRELDRVILSAFVLGLSTRKVGETLLSILGRPVSPTTVSQVAKTLDAAVAAFHRRPLQNQYKVLMLDGVVLARKTGDVPQKTAHLRWHIRLDDCRERAPYLVDVDTEIFRACARTEHPSAGRSNS